MFTFLGIRSLFKRVACFAYSLVFAELFLRIFAPVAVFPRYVIAAPYGVRINEPNRQYWHVSPDVCLQIRTNSKGIRADEEIPYDKPPELQRILVLGDSFAMGYEATLEGMFTTRMSDALKSNGVNVQVVNLAVSGHGNAEELIVFREEGRNYRPDLVLLCWHSTDQAENVRSGLFELNDGELVSKNKSFLPGVEMQQKLNRIPGFDWVSSHSQLYAWAREGLTFHVAKPLMLALQRSGRKNHEDDSGQMEAANDYESELTLKLLHEINHAATEAGASFLVLDIPIVTDEGEVKSVFPSRTEIDDLELSVISPVQAFEPYHGQQLYHRKSHRHFTPLACKLVGDFLANEIISRRLLTPVD